MIQSLEHFWARDQVSRRFGIFARESDFEDNIVVRVICDEDGSPLEVSVFRNGYVLCCRRRTSVMWMQVFT